jgi:signal transduction histidine kinase
MSRLGVLFPGESEMAQRMRAFDWSTSPLGSVEHWPQSLRHALKICLTSRLPMHIWWSPTLTCFYNDAYIPLLGSSKHPAALGQRAQEVWAEVWDVVGPMVERVFRRGIAVGDEDMPLSLNRALPREEVFLTFSLSPVTGFYGTVEGIFAACSEVTEKVVGARRLQTLTRLASESLAAGSVDQVCHAIEGVLASNPHDVPCAALYLARESQTRMTRAVRTGLPEETAWLPPVLDLDSDDGAPWPLVGLLRTRVPKVVTLETTVPVTGPWPEPVTAVYLVPLCPRTRGTLEGVLIAGVSPRRPFDAEYQEFLLDVATHAADAIADARIAEVERERTEALSDITLLDSSQREARQPALRDEPADVRAATSELASLFRTAIEDAGVQLRVSRDDTLPSVHLDRDMWEKIVHNLIGNERARQVHEGLERRVEKRTEALASANAQLKRDLIERRVAEDQIKALFKRIVTTQEAERQRIAREIHDQLGQTVTALRMTLQAAADGRGKNRAQLARATELAAELDRSLDFLTSELRPASLDHLGLPAALVDLVTGWSTRFGIAADCETFGVESLRLHGDVEAHLYRITQEALHNVYKHAGAQRVSVLLERRGEVIVLMVEDDGCGFRSAAVDSSGVGLIGMRERAMLAGGDLEVESAPGRGTTLFVRVPVGEAGDEKAHVGPQGPVGPAGPGGP